MALIRHRSGTDLVTGGPSEVCDQVRRRLGGDPVAS